MKISFFNQNECVSCSDKKYSCHKLIKQNTVTLKLTNLSISTWDKHRSDNSFVIVNVTGWKGGAWTCSFKLCQSHFFLRVPRLSRRTPKNGFNTSLKRTSLWSLNEIAELEGQSLSDYRTLVGLPLTSFNAQYFSSETTN